MQGDDQSPQSIAAGTSVKVWDLPVRVFHWLLVVLVFLSWVSSEVGGNAMAYHMWIGYTTLTLLLFRIVWGFVGGQHARFREFVHGPGAVVRYLRGSPRREGGTYVGHNPAGGWSVLALLACLLVQAVTGLFTNDEISTEGPLAARVSSETSDLLSTVHRYNFYVLLTLVALHVAAVLFYLLVKRQNLVWPMFTGRKRVAAGEAVDARAASLWLAIVVLACAAGVVAWVVN
jgi:cytochrome b